MEHEYVTTVTRILLAALAGGLIGLERSYHGRPAGFRTHTLVCMSASLLMLFTVFQWKLLEGAPLETIRVDPTRMGQGIMTGIGFLGAGVIIKEGLTVRGLTTAASIWITASIGIVIGMGLYFAAAFTCVLSIGVLALFRWLENRMPSLRYARLTVRFARREHMSETELRQILKDHNATLTHPSYQLENEGRYFRYSTTIKTKDSVNFHDLAEAFNGMDRVIEFEITPTGD
jgi:putative Mg2+ transporter-C (MgtC) family protein